jgi:hypothetical protein
MAKDQPGASSDSMEDKDKARLERPGLVLAMIASSGGVVRNRINDLER